ncbi:potassium transporter TrkG [soil metagenome]
MRRAPAFHVASLGSASTGLARQILPVVGVLGFVLVIFACTMLVPLAMSWLSTDGAFSIWDESLLATGAAGLVMWLGTRTFKRELHTRDGFLLVSLVWVVLPAFAAVPIWRWMQTTLTPMSMTDAYFEAVSGLTTTGSTVIPNLHLLPASINLWRHLLVWFGGMGILVLAIAVLPLLGVGGSQLYKLETPGPMKETKLTPRIAETAKGLYAVYLGLTALCIFCYHWAGMDWFDAVCHGFSTLGLGGFSTWDDSFAHFADKPWVDFTAVVFMIVASCNFAVHFMAFRARSLRAYVNCPETRYVLLSLIGGSLAVSVWLYEQGVYLDFGDALRYGMFNTISVASTTGFMNADYGTWPVFAVAVMIFMSVFATSSGSTGGGIKMIRALVLLKQVRRELRRALHPRLINPVRLSGSAVENNVVFSILAFMATYALLIISGFFLLLASGLDAQASMTAAIASINNMGPGLGSIGPTGNYQGLGEFQTWVCIALMLLGRLELFTLLVLFTPSFWRR